jgi:hypothetical protein
MQSGLSAFVIMLIPLAFYAFGLWILLKFYFALAHIGEELTEIKTVLRQRLPLPPSPADR